ncbi:DoxX family protein [Salibacteraceae bacterium]|nr:DoxX family protein [Salibacteraceae bacterium]
MLLRISRLFVGSLFIVSGLIKANDPIGFSYKLNDYFAPGVFDMPWLDSMALELAVIACVAEIVLGIAILFGARMKLAAWSLLGLMVFFTFLTGYTAVANWLFDNNESALTQSIEGFLGFVIREDYSYMKDCGCFGDAIKLDPWESFLKDLVLMVFTVIIFVKRKTNMIGDLKTDGINLGIAMLAIVGFSIGVVGWAFPIWFSLVSFALLLGIKQFMKHNSKDWVMAGVATIITTWFCVYCINHLPIKDFRPYRVGNNIAELKECPPDAPQDVYEDTWYYKVNGEVGEYTTEQAPWNIEGAEFVDRETELISKGCEPPIHDFILEDSDVMDWTDDILGEEYMFLIVSYDLMKTDTDIQIHLNKLNEDAMNDGGPYVYGLAANTYSQIEPFRHEHQVMYDYLTADGTMLKTIIRANPGVVLLNKGTVLAKWHFNDLPSYDEIKAEYLN